MVRRFVRYFAPLTVAFAAILWVAYRADSTARLTELRQAEEKYVALAAESLAHDFRAVIADLLLLADAGSLHRALQTGNRDDLDTVATEFQHVAERKRVYDQIRFLDLEGKEVLRVNFDGQRAMIVPEQKLQSKVDRYYFRATIDLEPGTVFVSPFDLNVEDGRVETPPKPTVRFGTPVFDAAGRRRGIVVLNYLGANMLRRFARLDADSPGQAMLVNEDGYWLYAGDAAREWAFMFPDRRGVRFSSRYPDAWRRVVAERSGNVQLPGGLFTFAAVEPLAEAETGAGAEPVNLIAASPDYVWRVVSRIGPDELSTRLSGLRRNMAVFSLILLGVVAGGSWAVAKYSHAREQSETALRESEARFRQMADSIAEVFWLSSPDRRELHYVSPAFAEIWDQPHHSLAGLAEIWEASILEEDRPAYESVLRGLGTVEEFSCEYRIRRRDGQIRWIWDHGFAVRGANGAVAGYAGIAEDATPLQEAQQKVLQSERLAAIGEAMTGLAHESRNALQRSQACLEMLQKRVVSQPEALNLLGRIQAAVHDLHHLYERVRCYAAPIQMRRDMCDLRDVWNRARRDALACAGDRHINVAAGGRSSNGSPNARCFADPLAMGQVFRNVLENALDPELGASLDREIVNVDIEWGATLWQEEPAVSIRITDNGPGLDAAARERIFEPFFTTKARGTGLGLAISRRIIEAHGGTISASNGQHRGLTLEIILPRGPV